MQPQVPDDHENFLERVPFDHCFVYKRHDTIKKIWLLPIAIDACFLAVMVMAVIPVWEIDL